jgi:hypothetical protein
MKSKLPPRMPPHYTLPKLEDFKFDEVLSALEHAGWDRPKPSDGDASLFNASWMCCTPALRGTRATCAS